MKNRSTSILGLIIVLLLIIGVTNYASKKGDDTVSTNQDQESQEELAILDVKHQYKDDEHIFVGTIELPTPCHSYNAEVIENEENAEIKITTSPSDQICAQVITNRDFKVVYKAPIDKEFTASIDGTPYRLNIFEIPLTENIDTFELYIKG